MIVNRINYSNNVSNSSKVFSKNSSTPLNNLKKDTISFRGDMGLEEYRKFYNKNFDIDVSDCYSLNKGELPISDIPGLIHNFDIHYNGLKNMLSIMPDKKSCTDFMLASRCYSSIQSMDDNDLTAKMVLNDAVHTLESVPHYLQDSELKNEMVLQLSMIEKRLQDAKMKNNTHSDLNKKADLTEDTYIKVLKDEGLYDQVDLSSQAKVTIKPQQESETQNLKRIMQDSIRRNQSLDAAQSLVNKKADREIVEFLQDLKPLPAGYYDPKHSIFANGLHRVVVFELGAAFANIKRKAEYIGNVFNSVLQMQNDESVKDVFVEESKKELRQAEEVTERVKNIVENQNISPKVKEIFEAGFKFTQRVK